MFSGNFCRTVLVSSLLNFDIVKIRNPCLFVCFTFHLIIFVQLLFSFVLHYKLLVLKIGITNLVSKLEVLDIKRYRRVWQDQSSIRDVQMLVISWLKENAECWWSSKCSHLLADKIPQSTCQNVWRSSHVLHRFLFIAHWIHQKNADLFDRTPGTQIVSFLLLCSWNVVFLIFPVGLHSCISHASVWAIERAK